MSVPASSPGEFSLPPIIFGSSALGNLYEALPGEVKRRIVAEWFRSTDSVCIDTAGKYGAGLALEEIGDGLRALGISPDTFLLSNKLGWKRVPLEPGTPELEHGVWKEIDHSAVPAIGYDDILACWEQGNALLGAPYTADLVAVHDPDEYLSAATSEEEGEARMNDIIDAYRALRELCDRGEVRGVGIGAKDWRVIKTLTDRITVDWVMLAGSLTVYSHPREVLDMVTSLTARGVTVVNSAVFHSGFLVGGAYFDYMPAREADFPEHHAWRRRFFETCERFDVAPVHACVEFGTAPRGVESVALNTTKPSRVAENVTAAHARAPKAFWDTLARDGLINVTPEELRG